MVRFLVRALICCALVYTGLVGFIYYVQPSLLFHPVAEGPKTPRDFNLSYKDLRFPSLDGTDLHGWYVADDSVLIDRKKIPLVYCHGNGANLSRLAHVTKIFSDYGFKPFLFTYRGYGTSQHAALTQNGLIDDAVGAYDQLRTLNPAAPIFAWGHSLGAAVCAGLSVKRQLAGLILEAPFASVPEMASERYPWMPIIPALISSPFVTTEYVVNRLRSPLLVLHSNADEIIPIAQGRKVFSQATLPKQFIELEGIGHNDFPDVSKTYQSDIVNWVQEIVGNSELPF